MKNMKRSRYNVLRTSIMFKNEDRGNNFPVTVQNLLILYKRMEQKVLTTTD